MGPYARRLPPAEQSAQAAEDAARSGRFSGEHIVDHGVIGGRNFRFHEFRDRGDDLVGHFLAEAQRDEFLFQFIHGSKGERGGF